MHGSVQVGNTRQAQLVSTQSSSISSLSGRPGLHTHRHERTKSRATVCCALCAAVTNLLASRSVPPVGTRPPHMRMSSSACHMNPRQHPQAPANA